ncbi:MAG: prenyltransferase/squalene oxidase repeat-containing protein [Planctomycetota bacterium]
MSENLPKSQESDDELNACLFNDEDEQCEFHTPGIFLKVPPLLVSGIMHVLILMISGYFIIKDIRTIFPEPLSISREYKNPDWEAEYIFDARPVSNSDRFVEFPSFEPEDVEHDHPPAPAAKKPSTSLNRNWMGPEYSEIDHDHAGTGKHVHQCKMDGSMSSSSSCCSRPYNVSAVTGALNWLNRHQDADTGKWDVDNYGKHCKDPNFPCTDVVKSPASGNSADFDIGVTGLATLAFLGYGQTHRYGRYKKTVRRALQFLVKQQDAKTGRIGKAGGESAIYNHAIATMALCEAYAVTRDSMLRAPAQKAVDYILRAQNPGFGWKYGTRDGKNDSSVTGWMMLALKSAKMGKLSVPQSAFDGAVAWFDRVTRVSDGKVGYMRPGDKGAVLSGRDPKAFKRMPTMTAVAVLSRVFAGQKTTNSKIKQGSKIISDNPPNYNKPNNDKVNFYYWYYGTYAMFQVGGKKWQKWQNAMKPAVLKPQRHDTSCMDGSWDPNGEWCLVGGRVYATAINAMTLTIYWRAARAKAISNRKGSGK